MPQPPKHIVCPKCSNDYIKLQQPTLSDLLLLLIPFTRNNFKRFVCMRCLWEGRIYYKK